MLIHGLGANMPPAANATMVERMPAREDFQFLSTEFMSYYLSEKVVSTNLNYEFHNIRIPFLRERNHLPCREMDHRFRFNREGIVVESCAFRGIGDCAFKDSRA